MSPGDFDNIFVKTGDSESKEGLMVEVTGESLGSAFWLPRKVRGEE